MKMLFVVSYNVEKEPSLVALGWSCPFVIITLRLKQNDQWWSGGGVGWGGVGGGVGGGGGGGVGGGRGRGVEILSV